MSRVTADGAIPSSERSPTRAAPAPGSNHRPVPPRVVGGLKLVESDAVMPRTRLTPKRLAQFKRMLLERRRQLTADVRRLSGEAFEHGGGGGMQRSAMPIHMADIGSDNWEQEFDLILIDNERSMVREIDEALGRIEDGTYGVCVATHRPISISRLTAKPWARYCIEYARLREQGRVP